jgi:hypothetical protein
MTSATPNQDPYLSAFRGRFTSALRWPQLDALWQRLRERADAGWYLYAIGEAPPQQPAAAEELSRFIGEIDQLLRREHDEDFCGIVYADSLDAPSFVKIYDPNNLGVVCGFSDNPPLPGWTLSLLPPVDLPVATASPAGRQRWWRRLFGE